MVAPDVPVTATNLAVSAARNSPMLATDPTDARVLVMASRVDAPGYGCELDVSGDGGAGWIGAYPWRTLPLGASSCYGPQVAFDRTGRLYVLFVGLHTAGNVPYGVFLTTSTNRGRSFSAPRKILGPNAFGVKMAIDTTMGTNGRIHLVWLQATTDPGLGALPSSPNPLLSVHSDDGGRSFSAPVAVSDPGRKRVVAPALELGPDRRVHVLYYDLGDDARDYQGLDGPAWEGTWSLVVATSTDGGGSFAEAGVVDADIVPGERVMLIFTLPPAAIAAGPTGVLYVAWHDARNLDADVFLCRSIDGGRSWSAPRRLNDDAVDTLTDQYLPELSVAPNGRLDAVFYDRRNDPNNLYNDVSYTFSTDRGVTFAPEVKLDRAPSNTRVGQRYPFAFDMGRVEFGGHPAVVSTDDGAVVAWTDTRNADVFGIAETSGPTEQNIVAATVSFAVRP